MSEQVDLPVSELPVRFLLSDIDGTLLRPDHSLSQANIDAIQDLQQAGVQFTVASSRPPRAMRQVIEALNIELPTVAFNGGTITHADGSLLVAHRIDPEAVRTCLELFATQKVAVWVFADDDWLLLDLAGDYVDHERHALGYEPVQVSSFEPYLDRVDKIVAASQDFELLKSLESRLNPLIEG
ncbi:HAD-IIB family hydrolase, partial [Pseudomonas syringae]|uniref:HAD-IIB family hydrolase n=1 Tax=Pseudomonas syringae TaxID=317 RepID=UPI001F349151